MLHHHHGPTFSGQGAAFLGPPLLSSASLNVQTLQDAKGVHNIHLTPRRDEAQGGAGCLGLHLAEVLHEALARGGWLPHDAGVRWAFPVQSGWRV